MVLCKGRRLNRSARAGYKTRLNSGFRFRVYLSPQEGKLNRRTTTTQSLCFSAQRACELLESRRLLSAGDFDTTFGGGDGGVFVDFAATGSDADFGEAMAVQSDGKIVIAGT